MKTAEAKEKLKKVRNLYDFQREFYTEDPITGERKPMFELVYWNGENYTKNPAAITYNRLGHQTNIFIKCEDGYVEYPF